MAHPTNSTARHYQGGSATCAPAMGTDSVPIRWLVETRAREGLISGPGNMQVKQQQNNPNSSETTSFWSVLSCPFSDHLRQPLPLRLCLSPASFSSGTHCHLMMPRTALSPRFLSRMADPGERGLGLLTALSPVPREVGCIDCTLSMCQAL